MLDLAIRKQLGNFGLDVSFVVPEQGLTALFGRSGAGKTSVIAAIAGLLRPDEGHIRVAGRTLFDSAEGRDEPVHRRRVGYVFQEGRLFPHLSVLDNLLYGHKRSPAANRRIALEEMLELLGIGALLERRPRDLSGGEKQRVAIGRALLAQPELLLMDEPLASLDAPRKREILPYLERLRDELRVPIVYVSHAIEEVVRLANQVVVIDAGRVAATGTPEQLGERLDLRPLLGEFESGAVIDASMESYDPTFDLSTLRFDGGRLRVPGKAGTRDANVRARKACLNQHAEYFRRRRGAGRRRARCLRGIETARGQYAHAVARDTRICQPAGAYPGLPGFSIGEIGIVRSRNAFRRARSRRRR
jgi:molybdate transport system ATP-binding protein